MSTPQSKQAEPIEPVDLFMPHCGRVLIDEKGIRGWFYPISMALWEAIIGFHLEITKRYGAESLSYHRWNAKLGTYDTIIPYQTTAAQGLSVGADWTDPRNVKLLDDYSKEHGQDFFPACTIHTHVNAPAFESGTDAHDEKHQPGWHITIGKMLHAQYDLDTRFRLPVRPKVKKLTDTGSAYDLMVSSLFRRDADFKRIRTTPGNDHFHEFLDRVIPRGSYQMQISTGPTESKTYPKSEPSRYVRDSNGRHHRRD